MVHTVQFQFRYHPRLIELRRVMAPTAKWDGSTKTWSFNERECHNFTIAACEEGLGHLLGREAQAARRPPPANASITLCRRRRF